MKIFIVGISGKMGKAVCERANELGYEIAGGLDKVTLSEYPVFQRAADVNVTADAIIDFSRPALLQEVIALCEKLNCGCVLATTGYSEQEELKIKELSQKAAVFKSENMSLGVNALSLLAQKAAAILKDFDIEITETHHNQKADAPSGTAKLLCRALERGLDYSPEYVYGRAGACQRKPREIGVHALRGGSVVGEHTVGFYGADETVTLSHSAGSRKIFADGALKAAEWLRKKKSGMYDMRDMLGL